MDSSLDKPTSTPAVLEVAAHLALIAGTAWAVFCTLYTGRHNPSLVLMGLFLVWVCSPFAGFAFALRSARRYGLGVVKALQANCIVVTATAAILYGAMAFSAPSHHKAAAFLVVPAASWLAIGAFLVMSRFMLAPGR